MPSTSAAQHRLMECAAHTPGGCGGVPQSVGKEFVAADSPDAAPIAPQAGPSGRAAGIIFQNEAGEILLMHRGNGGDFPRTWGLPGGHQEEGETLEECARREALEETGFAYDGDLRKIYDDGQFCTYAAKIDQQFPVTLCDESTGYSWAKPDELPQPTHPGLAVALRVLAADTELAVAELIRDGVLPSPQYYGNMLLLDLRITGTGVAYRSKDDEHVFRDPALYLNPEFLARCNGLSVIVDHPDGAVLNSKEFVERIAGACMLPYIKGDEVWAIARVYEPAAIGIILEAIGKDDISTSPSVVFGAESGNIKVMMDGDKPLLIEGKPVLLDHIAIVSKAHGGLGVWDKGGPATGLDLSNGVLAMADDDKKADAHGEKLDRVLAACDSMMSRMDAHAKRMDDDDARRKADDDAKKADDAKRADDDAKKKADDDAKAAADAAAKKDDDDAKKADDDARKADEEAAAVADEQVKADSVFAMLGQSAPRPLNGESRAAYARRVVGKLKAYSPAWKNIDLSSIKDDAAFGVVQQTVYADAALAAKNPATFATTGGLHEVRKADRTGRMISTFHGSPNDWMAMFMAPARRVTHINKEA